MTRQKLREILDTMDVPEGRKDDYGWLNRNLGVRNSGHPMYGEARRAIRDNLKKEGMK